MNNIRPLKTEADYDWALAEVEAYFIAPPDAGTAEADRFDLLCDLIAAYDARNYPLPEADPIDFLQAHMREHGLKRKDLGEVIGHKSKATEVLDRTRPLSLVMIQNLVAKWGLPAECLIKPYPLKDVEPARGEPQLTA